MPRQRTIAGILILFAAWFPLLSAPPVSARSGIAVQRHTVPPGGRQTVVVHGAAGVTWKLEVDMPNGSKLLTRPLKADRSGMTQWSFVQPAHTIVHGNRRAVVRATSGGTALQAQYIVGFAPIDLVVPSASVPENTQATVWVHTRPHTAVSLTRTVSGTVVRDRLTTGRRGWAKEVYQIPNDESPFQPITVSIVASATLQGRVRAAQAHFQVLPFQFRVWFEDAQVLHLEGANWLAVTSVRPGENIRIRARSWIEEPAGPTSLCVTAHASLVQASNTLGQASMGCSGAELQADLRVPQNASLGAAQVVIRGSFINGTGETRLPLAVTAS